MKEIKYLLIIFIVLSRCNNHSEVKIIITNNDIVRQNETIEITTKSLDNVLPNLIVKDLQVYDANGQLITSQKIDEDMDSEIDLIIFQTDLDEREKQVFILKPGKAPMVESKTFCRFVPEREKDFAWENDRIAFRMYSRELSEKEGVDSGIDVWTKRVDHLVIDKWYEGEDYHTDHGEGLDFYKVGPSRGCGGSAILMDGKLQPTGGYVDYEIITNGPIRSEFELQYAPYEINGKEYKESRRINIDAGWNLNKIKSTIDSENSLPVAIGLKMQADPAKAVVNSGKGILSLWENVSDENGKLGQAVVINDHQDSGRDIINDHHLLITKFEKDNSVEYYAGAGWSKSSHFENVEDWNNYVDNIAYRINHPVKIKIEK